MTKPTIYITNLDTSLKYKVIDMNKETKTVTLFNLVTEECFEVPIADFSGSQFKVEKVVEEPKPEPMTEQEEVYVQPKGLAAQPYPFGEPEAGVTTDSTPEAIQVPEARTIVNLTLPQVTNRKEALTLSESYKEELKPVLERMKAVKEAVECGLKGEAKKIAYIIQWTEKYLAD